MAANSIGKEVSLVKRKTTPEAICGLIGDELKDLLRKQARSRDKLLALVVGVPAITNVDEGSVLSISTLEGWRSVPLRAMLSKIAGCLVIVENDTNLAAQGEHYCGSAQRRQGLRLHQYRHQRRRGHFSRRKDSSWRRLVCRRNCLSASSLHLSPPANHP